MPSPRTVVNPITGRKVKANGKIGKAISRLAPSVVRGDEVQCPPGMVVNPKTGRCVSETGAIGRSVLKAMAKIDAKIAANKPLTLKEHLLVRPKQGSPYRSASRLPALNYVPADDEVVQEEDDFVATSPFDDDFEAVTSAAPQQPQESERETEREKRTRLAKEASFKAQKLLYERSQRQAAPSSPFDVDQELSASRPSATSLTARQQRTKAALQASADARDRLAGKRR